MNNAILSLDQTAPGCWRAKYRGNYGTYTIKVELNGEELESCSCPSDYFPCKHIRFVQEAIEAQMYEQNTFSEEVSVKDILGKISHSQLKNFITEYARYNADFSNKLQLEFLHKFRQSDENNYAAILRKALSKLSFSNDDLYDSHDSAIEIDILDEWLDKAKKFMAAQRFDEALAIAKAVMEEYAEWMADMDGDVLEYIDNAYQEEPFRLLQEIGAAQPAYADMLFTYAIAELQKPKYNCNRMDEGFHELLLSLAHTDEQCMYFLKLQDGLLEKTAERSSYEAGKILRRKISFFRERNRPEEALKLIRENIQIESFRKELVEQKIASNELAEAKKLITDFLAAQQGHYQHFTWKELLLLIARKEGDKPSVRTLSFSFIENHFEKEYYHLYQSTFLPAEWPEQVVGILKHYEKKGKYFNESVADVLEEEKDAAGLLAYIEKHLSPQRIEQYYIHFVEEYKDETLALFQRAVNQYAAANTGRSHYEYIAALFAKISRISGGEKIVKDMVTQYRIQYKSRKAMLEILRKVQT